MENGLFLTLAGAAVTVGALHTLAPDHWVPFAAIARAQKWSTAKTARITLFCGFGHVTVSALLGLLGLLFGRAIFERAGARMEAVAGILLVGFGLAYSVWGMRRAAGRIPRQRTTLYGDAPDERVHASFGAAPLAEPLTPHVNEARLPRPARLLRPVAR